MPRVAIASLMHESNSFNPALTPLEEFDIQNRSVEKWSKGSTDVAGFLEEAGIQGLEIVPLFGASATPSGPVTRAAYEEIGGCIVENLSPSMPVDGVYLALHGAMVAEHIPHA